MSVKWDTDVLSHCHLVPQTNNVSVVGLKELSQRLPETESSHFSWTRLLVLPWSGNSISSNCRLWVFSDITFHNQKYWEVNIGLEPYFLYFSCSPDSDLFPLVFFPSEFILISPISKQIKLSHDCRVCTPIQYVSLVVLLLNKPTLTTYISIILITHIQIKTEKKHKSIFQRTWLCTRKIKM